MAWNNLVEGIILVWAVLNRVMERQVSLMTGIFCLAGKWVSLGFYAMELAMWWVVRRIIKDLKEFIYNGR